MAIDTATVVASAVAGGLGGFIVRLRALRHEELGRRFDDICKDIDAAANAGTDYWLLSWSEGGRAALEAKLVGFQHGIAYALTNLSDDHDNLDALCAPNLVEFMDSLTGGTFQSVGRLPDGNRAVSVQIAAKKFIADIRRQRQAALKWWPL